VNDREKNRLHGPVAGVRTEYFDCDPQTGEVSAKPRFANVIAYDLEGRTTSTTYENRDGSTGTTWFSYNDRGALAKTSSESAGIRGDDAVYHYDEAGGLLRVTGLDREGGERERSTYTYEPDGSKTEVRFGPSASEREEAVKAATARAANANTDVGFFTFAPPTTTIRYDPDGKPLEQLEHDDNHILLSSTIYTYDAQGRLTGERREVGHKPPFSLPPDKPSMGPLEREALEKAMERLFQPGTDIQRTTYAYDDQGRKVEEVIQNGAFGLTKNATEYDEHSNESVVRSIHESRDIRVTPDGELGEATEPKRTNNTYFFCYTYDPHGNWTEKAHLFVESSSGKAQCHIVERRTLTYW
jgi:hypothetical protein